MLMMLAFVGLTTGAYPVSPIELPMRRCQGRHPPRDYVWHDKPPEPLVRRRVLRRPGPCGS